jgi:transposase
LHDRPAELWAPLLAHPLRRIPATQAPRAARISDTTFLTMGLRLFSRQHGDVKCTAHTAGYKAGVVWSRQQAARGQVIFLASDLEQPAWEITELYRQRRQIGIFFRWLKRILGCRKSLGMSLQAAIHTLCAALATYLLLLIFAQAALPPEAQQGLRGLKTALRILRIGLAKPPGSALLKCLTLQ